MTPRVHGNTGKLPHNVTSYASIRYIVQFITNFAEQQAVLLPHRIPGYKRDDFKLLPSSITKKVNHYITVLQTILPLIVSSICMQYNSYHTNNVHTKLPLNMSNAFTFSVIFHLGYYNTIGSAFIS